MYSPHDQLPSPEPKTIDYELGHFYQHTAKHLIKDAVRIMDNGLHIDLDKVIELEELLVKQLNEVKTELGENPLIKKYLDKYHAREIEAYIKDRKSKMRDPAYYLKPFKHTDLNHRSYFMEEYGKRFKWGSPPDKLPTGVSKWPVHLVKKYAKTNKVLHKLLKGELPEDFKVIQIAMQKLAEDKASMYNQKYLAQAKNPDRPYPTFNPSSSLQKQELFSMLDIQSEETSKKTGRATWNRAQIERVNKETSDEDVKHLTQCFIDYSFAAIIKDNFIESFYKYTVDDRLYGNYRLLGAKSGRFTSSNPNLLNTPSTGSRFAKPVKACFTAPKGKIILSADYSSLEDRVIASLTRDKNKCAIFLQGWDGHSLNALGYNFPELGELPTLFKEADDESKGKYFKEILEDGTVRFFRQ